MPDKKMKVSTRLSLGFGIVAALGLLIAVTAAFQMRGIARDLDEVANDRLVKVALFSDVKDNLNSIARAVRNIVIVQDPVVRDVEKKTIAELREKNTKLLSELDKVIVVPQARELLKIITDTRAPYDAGLVQVVALADQGKTEEAGKLLLGDTRTLQRTLFKAVDDSNDFQSKLANDTAKAAAESATRNTMLLLALAAAMMLAGGVVGWMITRGLSRSLGAEPDDVAEAVQRVADGDLATPVPMRTGDATSVMAAVHRMQQSLSNTVNTVRTNADGVATASAQIAQGNQDLSQRTEEQASALQQTSATMTELSTTVRSNSDNAQQANQLARGASGAANKGGEVVGRVVDTMKGINDSSRKIADIISVIDGIAFQTNILALNAAVEAARAGEQGRGFAVVASEVRSLAQRSAEAAKEIKTLITNSVEQVEQGTSLVDQAGQSMQEIVTAIQRVSDIVAEISAASLEQSTGVGQVEQAVTQMDQVTQQNAALVEESAAAAESLKQQAQQMVQIVSVFKLAGGHAGAAVTPPSGTYPVADRRGPDRAKNVTRPKFGAKAGPQAVEPKPVAKASAASSARSAPATPKPAASAPIAAAKTAAAKTGTDDWESF